jgi:prevent-host-death family protein
MSGSQQSAKPQVISATILRTKTRDILEEAKFGGGQFIVETFGKPMAVIVGVEEYRKLTGQDSHPTQKAEGAHR